MSELYIPLPNALEAAPRYTTVPEVKTAMGISSDKYDDQVQQAIISAEYLIDVYLNTSFAQDPDPNVDTDDALDPPPIEGIPVAVQYAATVGSIKLMGLINSPVGGSDDFIGTVDFGNESRRAFNAMLPLLMGLKRGWGIS